MLTGLAEYTKILLIKACALLSFKFVNPKLSLESDGRERILIYINSELCKQSAIFFENKNFCFFSNDSRN